MATLSLEPTVDDLLKKAPANEREGYKAKILGAPMSPQEIQDEINKPGGSSTLNLVANAIARIIGNQKFIAETQKFMQKLKQMRDFLEASIALNKSKPAKIQELEQQKNTVLDLENRLDETIQNRHLLNKSLMSDIIVQCRAQRKQEVTDFAADLEREGVVLTEEQIDHLNHVPTGVELLESHPELQHARNDAVAAAQVLRFSNVAAELAVRTVETAVRNNTSVENVENLASRTQTPSPFETSFKNNFKSTQEENPGEEKRRTSTFSFADIQRKLADAEKQNQFLRDMLVQTKLEKGLDKILGGGHSETVETKLLNQLMLDIENLRNVFQPEKNVSAGLTPFSMKNTPLV